MAVQPTLWSHATIYGKYEFDVEAGVHSMRGFPAFDVGSSVRLRPCLGTADLLIETPGPATLDVYRIEANGALTSVVDESHSASAIGLGC